MNAAESLYAELMTIDDVRRLAARGVEELHLDFKDRPNTSGRLGDGKVDDSLREKISKALSGFANSDGGVLVIGVDDDSREIRPIAGLKAFHESIQEQVSRLVDGAVPGVVARAVPVETDVDAGVLLLLIPASDHAPHRAVKKQQYYFRSGESFLAMQHWQLSDAFGRRHAPKLRTQLRVIRVEQDTYCEVRAFLSIENIGRAIARFPLLDIRAFDELSRFKPQQAYEKLGLPRREGPGGPRRVYVGGGDHVVHAGHSLDVIGFEAKLSKHVNLPEEGIALWVESLIAADGAPPRASRVELAWPDLNALLHDGQTRTSVGS